MQFHKNSTSLLLIFIICCAESALSSIQYHKGRSAATYRIFPLYRRKLDMQKRFSTSGWDNRSPFGPASMATKSTNGEGRDLFKKFLMFRSLFQQQTTQPNVIVITQPPPTTTSPTTTIFTTPSTTTTTAAASPTATVTSVRDTKNEEEPDEMLIQSSLIDDKINEMENLKPQELAQQLVKRNKLKNIRKNQNKNSNRHPVKQNSNENGTKQQIAKNRQLIRRLRKRLQQQQQQQIQQNQLPNNVIYNANATNKKPATLYTNNSSNESGSNSNASGISNLNTNMRLQNIMNAFRKQTPVVYNY